MDIEHTIINDKHYIKESIWFSDIILYTLIEFDIFDLGIIANGKKLYYCNEIEVSYWSYKDNKLTVIK